MHIFSIHGKGAGERYLCKGHMHIAYIHSKGRDTKARNRYSTRSDTYIFLLGEEYLETDNLYNGLDIDIFYEWRVTTSRNTHLLQGQVEIFYTSVGIQRLETRYSLQGQIHIVFCKGRDI